MIQKSTVGVFLKLLGSVLVHRAFCALSSSNDGLTEAEIVDILSLDEAVLDAVFLHHAPSLRRLPAVLWARIRSDVNDYIVERDAHGGKVGFLHH